MRTIPSTPSQDARRAYLIACPSCNSSNGANAGSCWFCERPFPLPGPFDESAAPSEAAASGPPSFFPVLREELQEQAANDNATWDSLWPLVEGVHVEPAQLAAPVRAARPLWPWVAAGAAVATLLGLLTLVGSGVGLGGPPAPPVLTAQPLPGPATAALGPIEAPMPIPTALPAAQPVALPAAQPAALPAALTVAPAAALPVTLRNPPPPPAEAAAPPRAAAALGFGAEAVPVPPARPAPATTTARARRAAPSPAPAPAPAPVAGPCTAKVAALGLCTPPRP